MSCIVFESLFIDKNYNQFDVHTAASIGCEERIEEIIENESKAAIDKQNSCGWTPLMYAACSGNLKVMTLLLEEGANSCIKNKKGHTALMLAAKYGSTDAVSMLISYGTNINEKDLEGWSSLAFASYYGHRSVVQLLLGKSVVIDLTEVNDGLTPLMIAAMCGHEMIVRDLLQHGASTAIQSKSGLTASNFAMKNNNYKVKCLIDSHMQSLKNCQNTDVISSCDLKTLFEKLQLLKYYDIFKNQGIDLDTFWLLTEEDLKEIGIQLLGPRKKICAAIARWHQNELLRVNASGSAFENKLILEQQTLMQRIEQLQSTLCKENELKEIGEQKLSKCIETLKTFTDAIQQNMAVTLLFQEKLRQSHTFLKELLLNSSKGRNFHFKYDTTVFLLNDMDKLLDEVHHRILLSSQQSQF